MRIGAPQRPEMAAWRYGDQFGRRRRRHYAIMAGGVAVAGVVVVAGPVLGVVSGVAINPLWQVVNAGRGTLSCAHVRARAGARRRAVLRTRLADLPRVSSAST